MKKISVLHLSSERSWRGGEQQIAYLIDELEKLNVVNIVALKKESAFERHCADRNIKYFSLPFRGSFDFRTAQAIKRICWENKTHIIHMHSSKSHSIGVLSTVLGNPIPLVLSRRVDFRPSNSWPTRWKYNHPSIKRILCVSEKIREIMRDYVRDKEKCITVHSGIDTSRVFECPPVNQLRVEFNIPEESIVIGNTSALEDHKDYYTFIDTIASLKHDGIPVTALIIGTGSLERDLKSYAASKGLDGSIIFTGFRTDIVQLLPCLDVFLMTSKEEGLGTSILDAFLAGVPVVATSAGGIPEMVVHDRTGLLAPVGDSKTLARLVEELIGDAHLRNRIVENARIKVQEFSKQVTAKKTLAVYEEVLASSR